MENIIINEEKKNYYQRTGTIPNRHISMTEYLSGEISGNGNEIKPSKSNDIRNESRNQGSRNGMYGKKQSNESRRRISEGLKAYHELQKQHNNSSHNRYRTIREILREELDKYIRENCTLVRSNSTCNLPLSS